ncbi:hypothetical protein CLAFUW4_12173 [Fulvia fulva]|uniref:Uncharacterized protein n=1 Tax=Passalora fulva TaxID=5499 RepID=A0A9Q8PF06_PASFU|nr:uncharacterized protein CLAFUR5_11210 [Fulvia fulva]KAK4618121.1 hypothetical protein CLAFUR4_12178 [Fulvia fulva]KAK4619092.1 hypothetical protein CLAFUR0_12189 [Fulvia fulva]UJO21229.1 hypothetical protein CLAFUR5_11210 [Fulvia fulva]WPV17835.1 hypothetical protein CLAFUW4_12173 [Fulvia fulva]WPV33100.1 hypothetical protein CLAFUW7_12180 [Fulvia fulva]
MGINMAESKPAKPTLLTLPQEMRDNIYYFTFHDVKVDLKRSNLVTSNAGLVATCHHVRNEALAVYYKESILIVREALPSQLFRIMRQSPALLIPIIATLRISPAVLGSTEVFTGKLWIPGDQMTTEKLLDVNRKSIKDQRQFWRGFLESHDIKLQKSALQGRVVVRDGVVNMEVWTAEPNSVVTPMWRGAQVVGIMDAVFITGWTSGNLGLL